MSLKCGLLGEKLGHSRSPEIHRSLGSYEYRLYEKPQDQVEDFLLHGDYDVINVTIPYKKVAFGLCKEVSAVAFELGNVNVVVKRFDGTLYGDNTDKAGFEKLVEEVGADVRGKKCVVDGEDSVFIGICQFDGFMGCYECAGVIRDGNINDFGNLGFFDSFGRK